jgi:hypothetical protein
MNPCEPLPDDFDTSPFVPRHCRMSKTQFQKPHLPAIILAPELL